MPNLFGRTKTLHPKRSQFNLSYAKAYNCDMGQLIPTFIKYMVPGDIFDLTQEIVARPVGPLHTSAFAEINVHSYAFFCPLRVLMGEDVVNEDSQYEWEIHDHDFEKFIMGKKHSGVYDVSLPRWIPTGEDVVNDNWNGIEPAGEGEDPNGSNKNDVNVTVKDNGVYSLWDYLEYPVDVIPKGAYPLDFAKRMTNLVWNEWFRDQNYQAPVSVVNSDIVLNVCWKKDYFTSMLPWPQRGDPVAIPMRGNADVSLNIPASAPVVIDHGSVLGNNGIGLVYPSSESKASSYVFGRLSDDGNNYYDYSGADVNSIGSKRFVADLTGITGTAALDMAATFTVNDLRLAFQIQRWQELLAKTGSRYVEFLRGMYGTSPTDDTLQRPMFIGGSKSPVIISEVLQTSTGDSGVGTLAGHAISADRNKLTRFRANEFGLMMVFTVIKPKAMYQQGIDREHLYKSYLEFYNPAFVNLGEQGVYSAELYASSTESDNVKSNGDYKILGYQGRYNELRTSHDKVCGGLRDELSYWVQTRVFDSKPTINGQFMKCNPTKQLFEVQDEPAFVVFVNNRCRAFRPLPVDAQPGLIDHLYGERR